MEEVSQLSKQSDLYQLFAGYPHMIDVFVKVIYAYEKERMDRISNYCGICYRKLTEAEIKNITPYDFVYCCEEHSAYRNVFQTSMIRKQLNIPERAGLVSILKEIKF
jgi:hypothetical protein